MEAVKSLVIPFIYDLDGIPLEQLNKTLASSGFSSKID